MGMVVILTVDGDVFPKALSVPPVSRKQYKVGQAVELFGLNGEHQLIQKRTEIRAISSLRTPEEPTPCWRLLNTEAYALLECPPILGGALIDPDDASLLAVWMEFKSGDSYLMAGLNYEFYLRPLIDALKNGETVQSWTSGCIFGQHHLSKAIDLGLPEQRATEIASVAKSIGTAAHAIWVEEVLLNSISGLQAGDFILQIEGTPVGRMADVRHFSRAESINAVILRDREEMQLTVRSRRVPAEETPRIVSWAGAILQTTPKFALEQTTPEFARVAGREGIQDLEKLVYICASFYGSPANEYPGLPPVRWILEINKVKVSSLDSLLNIVTGLDVRDEDAEYIRVKLLGKEGTTSIVGIRLNTRFWPTWSLEQGIGKEWIRREL